MKQNTRTRSYKNILILVIILVMPGLLFYFLNRKAENRYVSLPILGPKSLSGTFHSVMGKKIPDTLYHQAEQYSFYNQDSVSVEFPATNDAISVVSFFYSNCKRLCPEVTAGIGRIANLFGKNEIIQFYSLSLDSLDGPSQLREYAAGFERNTLHWNFLSSQRRTKFFIWHNTPY